MDRERRSLLEGKWRYVLNRKLRKKIRKAEVLRLCLELDSFFEDKIKRICGTPYQDCPFKYPRSSPRTYCLADPQIVTSHTVLGCLISYFNEIGLERFRVIESWRRKKVVR